MKADLFILQICDFLDDGDGFYRLHEPSRQLSRLPGVLVVDAHFYHHLLPPLIEKADVLILPFIHDWDFFSTIQERRAAGKATVFEANDFFYDIQPWNPIAARWQDRSIQGEYRHYMGISDAVQTSTPELARRWDEWSRRVVVFPNHLVEVAPLAPPPSRPLTIGWAGSPGHFADWYHIAPRLQRWLEAHPDLHLAVMCNEFAKPFIQLPAERYHFMPFGSMTDYWKFLPSLDIGLAPLLPSEYNRCRSDVKFLEYASHGIVGIYADLEPYRETVVDGKTGMLYKTEDELFQHLDRLVKDAALRQQIRRQAYDYVVKNRRISDHIGKRLEFYRALGAPRATRGAELPREVVSAALRDGNYLQLRPQEPERELLAALRQAQGGPEQGRRAATRSPSTRESAQRIARLVDKYPNYLAALRNLGRMLNDIRQCREAIHYLERAIALSPKSASAHCELGRAYYLLGEEEKAQKRIEAGLEINPLCYPGWQYLLRLLAMRRSADGPRWAKQAHELYPYCFMLALAGARVYPGMEAVKEIHRLLDFYAPTFTVEERPSAASAFSQAVMETVGPHLSTPEALALLRRACEVFSDSARFAYMLGRALFVSGDQEGANKEYSRALDLRRKANLYHTEFPKEDGTIHLWQFAEHIRRWTNKA
jgi:tetratricopeptide (TPR) repeat protein